MAENKLLLYTIIIAVMVALMKILPLIFSKGKIKNRFLQSFLTYVPYAVMISIMIPEVFTSTSHWASAVIGLVGAIILAYFEQNLTVVTISAVGIVFVAEWIMRSMGVI